MNIITLIMNATAFYTDLTHSSISGYLWLILGLVLLMLEAGTPGLFYFIAFALGSFCTAPIAFLNGTLMLQAVVWTGSSFVWLLMLRSLGKKFARSKHKTNVNALIGEKAVVIHSVDPKTPGRVKVRGEDWAAISENQTVLHKGTIVKVVGKQGNKLIVR